MVVEAAARFELAHDVAVALAALPPTLRALAETLKRESVTQIARGQGVARSTIYARIVALRRELADLAEEF